MLNIALKNHFGHDSFRPGQDEIIQSILNRRDTLALMPTGGGKSLCFQLPALMFEGITLVISPLIALMKDQVDSLRAKGIAATFLNSSLSAAEIGARLGAIRQKQYKLVYLAPERLALPSFFNEALGWPVSLIAIDEAHCVSQWGHDFRPDYLLIQNFISRFRNRPIAAAFTATATPEVKSDIIAKLGLKDAGVFIRGFDRPNLHFIVRSGLRVRERYAETARLLKQTSGPAIVYVGKRDTTVELADYLKGQGIKARPYHAGMEPRERTAAQEDFMNDKVRVIVATIAFGMGVDKPDVRLVIHAHMPGSLENYYQEAGRAGRDGEKAQCVLLHSFQDARLHDFFIRKSYNDMLANGLTPDEARRQSDTKEQRLKTMESYVLDRSCRRQKILRYFGDPAAETLKNCQSCDACLNDQSGSVCAPSGIRRWEPVEGIDDDETLFEKLRLRRLSLARRKNVRPYMIFSDRVLQSFVAAQPVTEEAMMAINGVGPTLFNLYGHYFLRVIRAHTGLKQVQFRRGESSQLTAELYRQGKTVNEIMSQRLLKESTVLEHLCAEYGRGALSDISKLIPADILNEVKAAIASFGGKWEGLRAIKERCSERVEYHHIRLVLNGIKKQLLEPKVRTNQGVHK